MGDPNACLLTLEGFDCPGVSQDDDLQDVVAILESLLMACLVCLKTMNQLSTWPPFSTPSYTSTTMPSPTTGPVRSCLSCGASSTWVGL